MRRVIARTIKFSFLVRLKAPLQFSLSDIHLPSYRYIANIYEKIPIFTNIILKGVGLVCLVYFDKSRV